MLNMKKLLPLAVLLLAACNQNNDHSDSVVHAKVDSIVGSRMEEINRKAMEDLDQRMTIEVKQKADSIIAARRAAAAKGTDTAVHAPVSNTAPLPQ
jgi:predicted lipoprotein